MKASSMPLMCVFPDRGYGHASRRDILDLCGLTPMICLNSSIFGVRKSYKKDRFKNDRESCDEKGMGRQSP
jgi:hypothetical protein